MILALYFGDGLYLDLDNYVWRGVNQRRPPPLILIFVNDYRILYMSTLYS
jgi:hypothetical protein